MDRPARVLPGDCLATLERLALSGEAFDAVVCDPPYGVDIMGRDWDSDETIAFQERFWRAVWAVLKPGGHVLAFSAARTYHHLAMAVERAGFEIRDQLMWIYGTGMDKSHDVSAMIDRVGNRDLSAEAAVAKWLADAMAARGIGRRAVSDHFGAKNIAQQWTTYWLDGAVKPRIPSVEQWAKLRAFVGFGDDMDAEVARLNDQKGVDGEAWRTAEVVHEYDTAGAASRWGEKYAGKVSAIGAKRAPNSEAARQWQGWRTGQKPAHEPVVMARKPLSELTVAENVVAWGVGALNSAACPVDGGRRPSNVMTDGSEAALSVFVPGTDRYFYHAKASADDRCGSEHPTVKPIDLMRRLVRLVTPAGGHVLDPFAGSGTTGVAALREGCRVTLCELDPEYVQDIERRIALELADGVTIGQAPILEPRAAPSVPCRNPVPIRPQVEQLALF